MTIAWEIKLLTSAAERQFRKSDSWQEGIDISKEIEQKQVDQRVGCVFPCSIKIPFLQGQHASPEMARHVRHHSKDNWRATKRVTRSRIWILETFSTSVSSYSNKADSKGLISLMDQVRDTEAFSSSTGPQQWEFSPLGHGHPSVHSTVRHSVSPGGRNSAGARK